MKVAAHVYPISEAGLHFLGEPRSLCEDPRLIADPPGFLTTLCYCAPRVQPAEDGEIVIHQRIQ